MKIHTVDWRADAWLGGTSKLGPNEGWLYVTIINLIYTEGGPIEADKAWLGRVANMHGNAVNASLRRLIELGKVRETDGKLMANGCEKQLETAEKRARNWAANGGDSGRPSNKNNKFQEAPPSRARADTHAEPLSTIDLEERRSPPPLVPPPQAGRGKKNKRPFPSDWQPDEQDFAFALGKGHDPSWIDDQADRCRDHHAGKGNLFVDLHAVWRTWIRNAPQFEIRNAKLNGKQNAHDEETAALERASRLFAV